MPKLLRLRLDDERHYLEELAEQHFLLGGRALSSHLVAKQVPPVADPLGPFNIVALCCGVLAGTAISNANRLSIGARSPLTGTIKESNAGGTFAYQMGRLGLRAIVLEGLPQRSGTWRVIHIDRHGVRLEDGSELAGGGCYEKAAQLQARFGAAISFALIGPAAEALMRSAAIAVSDPQLQPARFCGRGGLGTVMAAKGVQAIVLDASGTEPIRPQDQELFKNTSRTLTERIRSTPQTAEVYRDYGTAAMVDVGQGLGFLPVRNFSRGRFELAERINGQALFDTIKARGGDGRTSHACMPGCLVQCSNVFADEKGEAVVSPLEYETIGMLGPNIGIGDLDAIARLNRLANDTGVDTIEIGAAIGVAMQAGLAEFGDSDAALHLLQEVRQASILGRVLGAGAETTGRVLGVYQVPVAKGQAFPAYDPRGLKGLAVTFATSPMGADHTAGMTIRAPVPDHHGSDGQAAASRQAQIGVLQWDALGFCFFLGNAVPDLSLITDLIRAVHGREVSAQQIREMAVTTLKTERAFNRGAGFGPPHDRLSEYFYRVSNPDTGTRCDIPDYDISEVMDDSRLDT